MYIFMTLTASAIVGVVLFLYTGNGQALPFFGGDTSPDTLKVQEEIVVEPVRKKKEMGPVKGIYLTASSANIPKKMDDMIALINTTELNAVVIDIKDYTGYVLYNSEVPLVNELKTERVVMKDVPAILKKLHDNNIYVIARQTVFQDPILAKSKKEWAIKNKRHGIWLDHKGLSWVDPTQQSVWEYNLSIAKEATALGFDEINLDYVRFPSDGNMSDVVYNTKDKQRYDIMREFYQFMSDGMKEESAYLSLDMFGFVMERHDGMSIGQRLEDAVDAVDFISPMMYPSHYPVGHLGLKNPAASPAAIFHNGMKKGLPYFEGHKAKVRPWIQAFNIGAPYGGKNIRAQIDTIEVYPNAGWLMWNASNRYTSDGLKAE